MSESSSNGSQQRRFSAVLADYFQALDEGRNPSRQDYLERFPDLAKEIEEFFAQEDRWNQLAKPLQPGSSSGGSPADRTIASPTPMGRAIQQQEAPSQVDHYEIRELVARGGMGVVHRAWDQKLQRVVALKMILEGSNATPDDRRRFRGEAEAAAQLDHPNIVPIYEVGEWHDRPYFVMKLIEGQSLAEAKGDFAGKPAECARLMSAVARAVHHAHQHGILHRDLKPGNILLGVDSRQHPVDSRKTRTNADYCLLTTDYSPYVTDFGLAKRMNSAIDETMAGMVVGTANYMAPEQAAGSKSLTTAADVFSLGVVLYELLTGQKPFAAETTIATMARVQNMDPQAPRSIHSSIPRDLETICLKCLDKTPTKRYSSADALADDLDRFLQGDPILARPATLLERGTRWVRRHPLAATLILLLPLLMISGLGWLAALNARLTAENRGLVLQQALAAEEEARLNRYFNLLDMAYRNALDNRPGAERLLEECPKSLRNWEWYLTRTRCERSLLVCASKEPLLRMVLSYDGNYAATMRGGKLLLWNLNEGRTALDVTTDRRGDEPFAIAPDGSSLAAVLPGFSVALWPANGSAKETIVEGLRGPIQHLVYSSSGSMLAFVDGDKEQSIKVCERQKPGIHREFAVGKGLVQQLLFREHGKQIAAIIRDGDKSRLSIWDNKEDRLVHEGPITISKPGMACFHPEENALAFVDDQQLACWDLTSNKQMWRVNLDLKPSAVLTAIAYAPDRRTILATARSTKMRSFDSATGEFVREIPAPNLQVQIGLRTETSRCLSGNGRRIASIVNMNRTIAAADIVERVEEIPEFASPIRFLAAGPDEEVVAAFGAVVQMYSWRRGTKVHTLDTGPVTAMAIDLPSSRLATASEDRSVLLWDLKTGQLQDTLKDQDATALAFHQGQLAMARATGTVLHGAGNDLNNSWDSRLEHIGVLVYSKDGILLAAGDDAGQLAVWDVSRGAEKLRVQAHQGRTTHIAFSGDHVMTAGDDGLLKSWDLAGKELWSNTAHMGPVTGLTLTGDGTRAITAGKDRTIKVWDVEHRRLALSLDLSIPANAGIALAVDNSRLLLGQDKKIKIDIARP